MTNNKVTFLDLESNEFIERDMTAEEIAQYEKDQADAQKEMQIKSQAAAKKAAAEAKLAALGLTAEDLKALGL
jgi:phosphopantetheinyl transferase (holo-ACP synthase)